jgi:hypothetical protein
MGRRLYGSLCVIDGHRSVETVDIKIKRPIDELFATECPSFLKDINDLNEIYYPAFVTAKKLGMSGLTLSKVTSSMDIDIAGSKQRVNIGLCLKVCFILS